MVTPSTDVIHSTKLTGAFFLKTDVLKFLKEYSDANVNDIQNAVFDLPTYIFETSNLVKKDDVEKIVLHTPAFFRRMESEVTTILFTRFGLTD
jgi:hypothetical protein